MLVSIVVPCYNEEEALPIFMEEITKIRSGMREIQKADTEIILVDDGSKDRTLEIIKSYNESDASVHYVSFSRNFGKEAAIYAGLNETKGDYVVLLDADLQHPVEYIPQMYDILHPGQSEQTDRLAQPGQESVSVEASYDSVAMFRPGRSKGEGRLRAHFSKRFFRIMNRLSKIDLVDGATDYRMMTRGMVDAVLSMQEYNRFTKGIFNWVGFKTKWLAYEDAERCAGTSKWSFKSLLRYAFEGMFAFSTRPLTISFSLGLILCGLAIVYAIVTVIKTLVWGDPVAGYPSLFTMILLLGGVQLLFLGIIGQYMAKMYLEVKNRPIYITKEKK